MFRGVGPLCVMVALIGGLPARAQEAPSTPASAAAIVADLQSLVRQGLDASLQKLSTQPQAPVAQAVNQATVAAMTALARQDAQGAIDQLAPLARFQPLQTFPSYRVQAIQAQAYRQLGDTTRSQWHLLNAKVLSDLAQQGTSASSPFRATHYLQLGDVIALAGGEVQDTRTQPLSGGGSLITVLFKDDPQGLKTRYIDTTRLVASQTLPPRYSVLMKPDMPADMHAALAENQAMLARFYADQSLDYAKLDSAVRTAMTAADTLLSQRKPAEALQALQRVAELRPLEEIPHVPFLTRLSLAYGETGQRTDQQRLRRQLFGLQQAIAATGDAMSFETAVEVPFIAIEYDWLQDRQLRRTTQRLVHQGDQSFDVLEVVDAQGNTSQRYFNITRMFKLRAAALERKP